MNADFIPLSVPTLRGREAEYVRQCIDTNWVSYLGPFVERFEHELAAAADARFAVVTSSGTAALHLALIAAGVEADTEVVMPGMTFVAPGNAVRYCGAWPTFIDQCPRDWQIDVEKLADFLQRVCVRGAQGLVNRETGRRVAALLPVHLLGDMGDVDAVAALAAQYDLPLVEDAAECIGATYRDRPIGAPSPRIAANRRQVITSFNGNKIITTGGGGAVFTDDADLAHRVRHLSTTAKTDALRFLHDEVGYNYRMTNLAAALGVAQLEQLDEFVGIKRSHADWYANRFRELPNVVSHPECVGNRSIFWLYTVLLKSDAMPAIRSLNASGIGARPAWTPLYRLPQFAGKCYVDRCEFTERFAEGAISLPSSVSLTEEERCRVASALEAAIR